MTESALRVLLVEDNPVDVRATLRAVERLEHRPDVVVAADGDRALAHLRGADPNPHLVLLDLNLPGRDGHDVLAAMQADPSLRRIPVVVVTTSLDAADLAAAYDRGANAYVSKPGGLVEWQRLIDKIASFWFSAVHFPPG